MGMPLELNTMIVTKGREKDLMRITFHLSKKGTDYIRSISRSK